MENELEGTVTKEINGKGSRRKENNGD